MLTHSIDTVTGLASLPGRAKKLPPFIRRLLLLLLLLLLTDVDLQFLCMEDTGGHVCVCVCVPVGIDVQEQ